MNYDNLCFSLWWEYAFKTGPEYKRLYPKVLLSRIPIKLKKDVWRLALQSRERFPGVYGAARQIYRRTVGRRN